MRLLTLAISALQPIHHIVPPGAGAAAIDPDIEAFLVDYIRLFTREALPRWRELFLPGAVVTAANDDGTVTTWTRDGFYERQRAVFATGKPITEYLQNTRVERTGRLASVRSEFVWSDGTIDRRGRLMLLLVDEHGRPKAQALAFSYGG